MTRTPQTSGDLPEIDARAGEYVLGLLPDNECADFVAELETNPALRAQLRLWQARFTKLDSEFEEVAPPADVFKKIETRLFGKPQRTTLLSGLWQSVSLWRGAALAACALFVVTAGVAVWPMLNQQQITQGIQYAASLQADGSDVRFLALYDSASGKVRLAGVSGDPVADRDFELWFIEEGKSPLSLGVVPVAGKTEMDMPTDLRTKVANGVVFAVTLEPKGGAPLGVPTGPVVAAGPIQQI